MRMTQTETRNWLKEQIEALQLQGLNVYRYPVELITPPAVFFQDPSIVLEETSIAKGAYNMNLTLVCVVHMLVTESAMEMLETLTDSLRMGLPAECRLGATGGVYQLNMGESIYYARNIDLQITI